VSLLLAIPRSLLVEAKSSSITPSIDDDRTVDAATSAHDQKALPTRKGSFAKATILGGIHTSKYRASSPLHRLNVCISIVRSFKGAAPLMNFDTAGDHVHSIKGG